MFQCLEGHVMFFKGLSKGKVQGFPKGARKANSQPEVTGWVKTDEQRVLLST